MGRIKNVLKKILFSYKCDSDSYINHLRSSGAKIGERVIVFDPRNTVIDETRPFMITIGNDVQITSGVTILTHGYDWSVSKGLYGTVLGSCGEVVIGNNCFIGMNSTILKGVHIGDNCIIGANSLVNHDVESGWVVAGNPAKKIMDVETYHKKRLSLQLSEAEKLYRCYYESFKKDPPIEAFDEFFWLFGERKEESLTAGQLKKMQLLGNYDYSLSKFLESKPMFNGYDDFLKYLKNNYRNQK